MQVAYTDSVYRDASVIGFGSYVSHQVSPRMISAVSSDGFDGLGSADPLTLHEEPRAVSMGSAPRPNRPCPRYA
jgi:hypothetical protein